VTTKDLLKQLANNHDIDAATALHREAIRTGDTVLLRYLGELAQRAYQETETEIERLLLERNRWRDLRAKVPLVLEAVPPQCVAKAVRILRDLIPLDTRGIKELVDMVKAAPVLLIRQCDSEMAEEACNRASQHAIRMTTNCPPGVPEHPHTVEICKCGS